MTETEITIKLAELSAEVKRMNVLSDLVKIGLPSLVALVSAYITYLISRQTSKQNVKIAKQTKEYDVKIEQLKINSENNKEFEKRAFKLTSELSDNASEIYNAALSYHRSLSGLLLLKSKNGFISESHEKSVNDEYVSFGCIYGRLQHKIKSRALLLGNDKLTESVKDFLVSSNEIIATCSVSDDLDENEVLILLANFESKAELLFSEIAIFLKIRETN